MKILLTGASGMLGSAILKEIRSSGYEVTSLCRTHPKVRYGDWLQADLYESEGVHRFLGEKVYDVCIHCAAMTSLKDCQEFPNKALNLHVKATDSLARALPEARFVYVSTDSVFDGKQGNYLEASPTNPLNVYSETKLSGERVILLRPNSLVVRTNMFDIRLHPRSSLAEWAYKNWCNEQPINGYTNIQFNPLNVHQLASCIVQLAKLTDVNGILHLGSDEPVSKFDFLQSVARILKFSDSLVLPFSYSDIHDEVQRPLNTTLAIDIAKTLFDPELLSLQRGLEILRENLTCVLKNEKI